MTTKPLEKEKTEKKNTRLVLSRGAGLIIIHVQHLAKQRTPFSKVKSPVTKAQRGRERVREREERGKRREVDK